MWPFPWSRITNFSVTQKVWRHLAELNWCAAGLKRDADQHGPQQAHPRHSKAHGYVFDIPQPTNIDSERRHYDRKRVALCHRQPNLQNELDCSLDWYSGTTRPTKIVAIPTKTQSSDAKDKQVRQRSGEHYALPPITCCLPRSH